MKKSLYLIFCGILILGITGCGQNDIKKMTSHLEDVDYKCEENEDKYVCKRIDGDKTETVELEEIDRLLIEYTVEYRNQYTMSINSDQYKNSYLGTRKEIIFKNFHADKYTCYYMPERLEKNKMDDEEDFWKTGDNVKLSSLAADDCENITDKKINNMLREFESYYSDVGIELGK